MKPERKESRDSGREGTGTGILQTFFKRNMNVFFVLVFGWALGRHGAVPLKDPCLAECLDYHS